MAKRLPSDTPAEDAAQVKAQRDERIWKLHITGYSARAIGAMVSLSHTVVLEVIHAHKDDSPVWSLEQVRQTEHDRLTRLLVALDPAIGEGDTAAIAEARKISESLRKLYGADGSLKIDINDSAKSPVDEALEQLFQAADAKIAAQEARLRGDS